jgi:hypothetical protein
MRSLLKMVCVCVCVYKLLVLNYMHYAGPEGARGSCIVCW